MDKQLLILQSEMLSLLIEMQGMIAENQQSAVMGEPPKWSKDHFNELQSRSEGLTQSIYHYG